MEKKQTASEEFLDSYFDAFKRAFGSDLRPCAISRRYDEEPNVEIVPDSYEEEDRKLEIGQEVNSSYHQIVEADKFRCPDLNIPYTNCNPEGGSSSEIIGNASSGQGKCNRVNPYMKKYKRKPR